MFNREWQPLIYNNEEYKDFVININGEIKNIKTNHIYKIYIHKINGYAIVSLPMGKRGKSKVIRLHKALAETFIPNPQGYKVVHHKDENRANYSLDNLEWTTQKRNVYYHLYELSKETELFNNRKLTRKNIEFILDNKGKISYNNLAKMFNVSKTVISRVMNNQTYNDIK